MSLRYYKNGPARALSFPLANATDTSITVDSAAGFPTQFPYTLILDPDQSTEEVVDVTAAAGNVLTITRGVDSTTAVAHAAGIAVYHGVSARDHREANEHINDTTSVHGTTGSLVDTDSLQTITGRKLFVDAESSTGGNFIDTTNVQTITGRKIFDDLETTAGGDVVALAGAQVITGAKDFTGAIDFTGTNTHTGLETFSGDVAVAGANITGAWTSYTPSRLNGAGGSALGTGNGTMVGRFKHTDKMYMFRISFTFGTTSAIGTDDYSFTLPVSLVNHLQCGPAVLHDLTQGKFFAKMWHGIGGNEIVIVAENGDRVSGAGGGSPIAWATGDDIVLTGVFEAA